MTHQYPVNSTVDSVTEERVKALASFGFTKRQCQFLVAVMVHAGCFLERQYCAFTGTVRGQNSRDFVGRLVLRGFARAIEPGPVRRGRLYHVHHRPLYDAIGQADNRNRRLLTVGRMVERVMILDAVLGDRHCWWLSPEADKRRFFALMRDNYLRPEDYPHIAFGDGRQRVIRCFPDKLPIGVEKGRSDHLVFLYLVNRRIPVDFRQFLIRHAGLLRFVRTWTLRLLVPRRFRNAVSVYKAAVREELWTPMDPSVTKALEAYFPECQSTGAHVGDPADPYIRREFRRQGNARVQALYRAWRRQGDGVLWDAHSSTLADDRARGCSTVEVELLNRQYLQLAAAMDRDPGPRGEPSENRVRLAPLFRSPHRAVSPPWSTMSVRPTQTLDVARLGTGVESRRRCLPPRVSLLLPMSQQRRWRERPRCHGLRVTPRCREGSFTPSLVVPHVAVSARRSCRKNAPPACTFSCRHSPEEGGLQTEQ